MFYVYIVSFLGLWFSLKSFVAYSLKCHQDEKSRSCSISIVILLFARAAIVAITILQLNIMSNLILG